jgi:dihydroorotate dehydrogenase electron transfer subunit
MMADKNDSPRLSRVQASGIVDGRSEVADGIFLLRMRCPEIASTARAGQFVNIRAMNALWGPYLPRPFSISNVSGDVVEFLFNVIGSGTTLLAGKEPGEKLDVLGPLGTPFGIDDDFETAIMVAGGLGFAPFPFLHDTLRARGRKTMLFLGARSSSQVYSGSIEKTMVATDDGSEGYHGTVVALMERTLKERVVPGAKIFGCGPTRMLKALSDAALSLDIPCEISLEGDMACGIGICQGCPVETKGGVRKYSLVCTDGPTFDCREVVI